MASARSDSSSARLSASARIAAPAFRRAASIRAERTAADTAVPSLVKTSSNQQSAERLQRLGYAVAIHPSAVLAPAARGALTGLCTLSGASIEDHLPTTPERFFDLVGMAEWSVLGDRYQPAPKQTGGPQWA